MCSQERPTMILLVQVFNNDVVEGAVEEAVGEALRVYVQGHLHSCSGCDLNKSSGFA